MLFRSADVEGGTKQSFSPQAPLLFNGCRSGEIFAIDLRCQNQGKGWKATRLFHDSAVTSVQILQEEQCLMASDMAGTVGVLLIAAAGAALGQGRGSASKFAGILSATLSQHHLSGFEIPQLEFHHLH